MVRRKVGDPDRRRWKTVSPDSEEATDVSTFAEAVVYLTNDRRFELVPLLGDGRNHGLISLLKREKITHLTVRRRLKAYSFKKSVLVPEQRLYIFALVSISKFFL